MFHGTVFSLLPAVIAIVLALITKEVYSSLFAGIFVGAFLSVGFHPVAAFNLIVVDGLSAAVSSLAGNTCFLIILGSLVVLVNMSGGSVAFGRWAGKKVKSRTGAGLVTFLLGVLIFIDDYFNCLTVGSVMRPVTDQYKISRAKLAYLIDATAAPICMIAPISSWAAAVAFVASDMGTGITGIQLFIRTIPYNFYSLLTLFFIPCLLLMDFDYGKMKESQRKAGMEGKNSRQEQEDVKVNPRSRIMDLILPMLLLIFFVTLAMLYAGGFYGQTPWIGPDNTGNIIESLGNTDAFIALPLGSLAAYLLSCLYFAVRKTVSLRDISECLPKGFSAMIPSILILTLATAMKTVTSSLGAAEFVHDLIAGSSSGMYAMLPAVIFLVSIFLAFATGTSWGTFSILIPVAAAAFPVDDPLLIIGISACLAGAVCGDHCSPISDTTIMSSAGAQADHLEHVSTQLPYAFTVAAVSMISYIVAGFTRSAVPGLAVGAVLILITLTVLKKRSKAADDKRKKAVRRRSKKKTARS